MSALLRRLDRPDRLLDVPGGRLAAWRFGQGPDLVAVHGWPLNAATWRHVLPALVERFTVHLVDLPFARESRWNGPVDLASCAAAVRAFVAALGLERYALLGQDSGGTFARMAGAGDPRLAALVLANTEIPGHHSLQFRAFALLGRLRLGRAYFRALSWRALRRSRFGLGPLFTDPSSADGDFDRLFLAPLAEPEALERMVEVLHRMDLRFFDALADVHARIAAPTLCIWGADDPFFPVARAREMLPGFGAEASLVEIPGARLLPHEDHAQAFVAHALPFLARHLGPSRVDVRSA